MKILAGLIISLLIPAICVSQVDLKRQAEASLKKGVAFFHNINTQGGYVYYVTPDLSLRWGEGPKDSVTIEVQPPALQQWGSHFCAPIR